MNKRQYWFSKPYADFVARLRVPCGFLLLAAFAWLSNPTASSIALGFPLAIAGLGVRGWAAGHLAKNQQLATGGPYAYIRNPLYAGTLITATGIVTACRDWALAFLFAVVFLLVYLPVIELEEQHLRTIFPAYSDYASRVHRLLPVRKWHESGNSFSWALYCRNEEYKAALGLLVALLWLTGKLWFLARA